MLAIMALVILLWLLAWPSWPLYFMLWFIELTFTLHNWHELELVGVGHVQGGPHPMRLRVGALWPTLLGKFLVTVQSPSCLIVDPINQ